MGQVKILSGWSQTGGSTTANINLTNALNQRGINTVFCGPHEWHLGKCEANYLKNVKVKPDDYFIMHYLPYVQTRPDVKKFILSVHEKEVMPLSKINWKIYDKVHFLNEAQYQWHQAQIDEEIPYFICGNAHEKLLPLENKNINNVAGIIGSIDRNKQTHESIERALNDGMHKIIIFGNIHDNDYFNTQVKPLIEMNGNKIVMAGFVEDKNKIYDTVTDVYLSSLSENASLVADECQMTGVKFHGNANISTPNIMPNDEIVKIWKRELEL